MLLITDGKEALSGVFWKSNVKNQEVTARIGQKGTEKEECACSVTASTLM